MFKKLVMVAVLVMPIIAFANSIDIFNSGGTTHNYVLTGALGGAKGERLATTQLTDSTGIGFFNGSTSLASGRTNLTLVVPEPGTLILLGTGLTCLVGISHKRNL